MLLRRITKHVKDQNWFAIGLDFLIVVVGILIAFQITNWTNEQERREIEANYTERLHGDVVNLQSMRSPLLAMRIGWHDGLLSANSVLFGEATRQLTTLECEAIGYSYITSSPTEDLATLIELQGSGQLSLFHDARVSAGLQEFLLTQSRARDVTVSILNSSPNLLSKYPDLIQVEVPTRFSSNRAVYQCDTKAMRLRQAFMNDYEVTQLNFSSLILSNNDVSDSLSKLHKVLDEVLGLAHKENL